MTDLSEMIDKVFCPPRLVRGEKRGIHARTLPENFKYYKYWGFTIYRTYYGPDSDGHWETLLGALKQQTRLSFGCYETEKYRSQDRAWCNGRYGHGADYDRELSIFKDLFRLFPREDRSLLSGLSIEGIRDLCIQEQSQAEEKMAGADFNFVLVADEAVFKDIAREVFVVKALGYDWDPTRGRTCWMRVSTASLLNLWGMLLESELLDIGKYYTFRYEGSKEDLKSQLWDGNPTAPYFEDCTEAGTAQREIGAERFTFD
ncbi:uncharacterized protein B0J16DRAFT_331785 [Fusarium flagelliforme]|uniref:uncharacterized protein n=1 Tax=Fusarium flagelliforme TaxID=2675880 RepID=UPI001E8E3396|nr:uncharacterized protein B0J16DRAFT_331785 [Fusarium flagelliforme]KAH7191805.1 hypothetical protein B0J16DRAFT_331785 [Fusarium flagelliforme]